MLRQGYLHRVEPKASHKSHTENETVRLPCFKPFTLTQVREKGQL